MDIQKKLEFLQNAKENLHNGSWIKWSDAIILKEGDDVKLDSGVLTISKIYQKENEFGILEMHASGRFIGLDGGECGLSGVISVCIPDNDMDVTDAKVVYTDDKLTIDKMNGYYKLSFFGADNKCTGEIRIMENGRILFDSFSA